MSNKYADLPDIDTAQDVYETEDTFPETQFASADLSDSEAPQPLRGGKGQPVPHGKEELDTSSLINTEDATRKFRKAEKRTVRSRVVYTYPESPTGSSTELEGSGNVPKSLPLSQRLRSLQAELASLEQELADPTNPLIQKEREDANVDPGELIKGLVDVRGRLTKIYKEKEGRARLVDTLTHDEERPREGGADGPSESKSEPVKSKDQSLVEVDRRVEELEKLLGSSNAGLDETSPLPPPLLPSVLRMNSQLALLTQSRHIDAISRRLKMLLTELERVSVAQQHRRQGSHANSTHHNQEQLLSTVNRIAPSLPQIPHILARLRTLSTLHAAAGEFQDTLGDLEQEQKKLHGTLLELQSAVDTVEKSLEENRNVVKGNVTGLDTRVEGLLKRLEDLKLEELQSNAVASEAEAEE